MERRNFIKTTGFTAAGATSLAGCMGGDGDGDGTDGDGNETDGTDGGQDLSGPVPEQYRTAESLSGTPRNPDSLQSKSASQYQSEPQGDQDCSNCTQYIPDKDGDGLGACALVEGKIEPAGWCALYSRYEEA